MLKQLIKQFKEDESAAAQIVIPVQGNRHYKQAEKARYFQ